MSRLTHGSKIPYLGAVFIRRPSQQRVEVRVDALTGAAATDAAGIAGYRITRNGTLVTTLYGTATTITDTGLDPSTAYTCTRRAFDAAGNQSAASGSVSGDDELTNGAYGTASYGDAAWQGRNTGSSNSITVEPASSVWSFTDEVEVRAG
jgi:hypothetical protein